MGGTGRGRGQADGAGRCTDLLGASSTYAWEQLFETRIVPFSFPQQESLGLITVSKFRGMQRQRNPSFAISVQRERAKTATGKGCFFLKYGISFVTPGWKEKKKINRLAFCHAFFYRSGLGSALASWQEREARQRVARQLPGQGVTRRI